MNNNGDLHFGARLPNTMGAEEPNKPSRKIVLTDDFPNA
jgi:hypothetical protein